MPGFKHSGIPPAVLIACVFAFSLMTVALQVRALGIPYVDSGPQLARHRAVLEGTASDPWQYRVLSDLAVEEVLRLVEAMGAPHPVATAFILFRLLQNALIFVLAAAYFRSFELGEPLVLLGLSCLAWGMTHAVYNSDLQFNTYSDIIFYLAAALLLIRGRSLWIPAISVLAALNRETSLLIPLLVLGEENPGGRRQRALERPIVLAGIGLLAGVAVVWGLRFAYGPRLSGLSTPPLGLDMLRYNLFRYHSWVFLFATLGPLPIMAFLGRAGWPRRLRIWFWVLVPIWFLVHFFVAIVAEARLFLVPQVLIFIPGALLTVKGTADGGVGGPKNQGGTARQAPPEAAAASTAG